MPNSGRLRPIIFGLLSLLFDGIATSASQFIGSGTSDYLNDILVQGEEKGLPKIALPPTPTSTTQPGIKICMERGILRFGCKYPGRDCDNNPYAGITVKTLLPFQKVKLVMADSNNNILETTGLQTDSNGVGRHRFWTGGLPNSNFRIIASLLNGESASASFMIEKPVNIAKPKSGQTTFTLGPSQSVPFTLIGTNSVFLFSSLFPSTPSPLPKTSPRFTNTPQPSQITTGVTAVTPHGYVIANGKLGSRAEIKFQCRVPK
jgi:hypothetical protein